MAPSTLTRRRDAAAGSPTVGSRRSIATLALLGALAATAAPAEIARPEPDLVQALVGARVVVAPGRTLPEATVVLRNGVITAVGSSVQAPPEARIWNLSGKTLYPGLIDSWVPRPWPEEKEGEAPQDAAANDLVRPQRDVLHHLRDAELWRKLRAAGFTTALVVPEDGIFRGRGAVANLGDDPPASVLRADALQAVSVRPPRGRSDRYPESLMGAVALFRQTMLDARWYRQAQAAFRANPSQQRPPFEPALAALEPAAHGEAIVAFETENVLDELRVRGLAEELGLRAWWVGNGEEYRRLDEIAARPLPILLPIAFPERPKVGESDDLSVGLDELRHWDAAPANPGRLAEAKLPFALTAFRQKEPKAFWKALARAIERGLSRDAALAALTQVPAELFGLSGRAGTLEAGKMANLVQVDGELWVAEPKIEAVWIDGVRYESRPENGKGDSKGGGR